MTTTVVFAFAVDPALPTVAGAAPMEVLARQLPRLVVHLMNETDDRGMRYFPFMGRESGVRRFFSVPDLLPFDMLAGLHGQQIRPNFLADGRLHDDGLRLRVHDDQGALRFDGEIPFVATDPLPTVTRVMFELAGVLGWSGAPPAVPALAGASLTQYLIARDDLLALEADILDETERRPLESALRAVELAPAEPDTYRVFLEVATQLHRRGTATERIAPAVQRMGSCLEREVEGAAEIAASAATLLEVSGEYAAALHWYEYAAELDASLLTAVCRAATLHFETGALAPAQRLLRTALASGLEDPTALAQLAVIEQRLGNDADYRARMEQLLAYRDLRPAVVRIAVSYLLEQERATEALELTAECVAEHPAHAGAWFDRGRVLIANAMPDEGTAALDRCLACEPSAQLVAEIDRQRRLAAQPELLGEIRALDAALAEADLRPALEMSRRLTREHPQMPEVWLFLGVTLQRMDRARRAERALRKALALEPDLGEARNRLGILLVSRGNTEEGYDHLVHAVRLLPHEPSAHLHLAQACQRLGRWEEGLAALDRAESLGGSTTTVAEVRGTFGTERDGTG